MADELNWGALYDSTGDADAALPSGPYDVEVTKVEVKTTKTGKPMFSLMSKVIAGPMAGRTIFHNITVTADNPNAMRMFFLNMKAFGLDDSFFKRSPGPSAADIANALTGRRAKFDVAVQTTGDYAGRNEVKKVSASGVPALGGPGVPAGIVPSASAVAATVPGIPNLPAHGSTVAPNPAASPADDEEEAF